MRRIENKAWCGAAWQGMAWRAMAGQGVAILGVVGRALARRGGAGQGVVFQNKNEREIMEGIITNEQHDRLRAIGTEIIELMVIKHKLRKIDMVLILKTIDEFMWRERS